MDSNWTSKILAANHVLSKVICFPELSVLVIDIKYLGVFNSEKYLNCPSIISMVPQSVTCFC